MPGALNSGRNLIIELSPQVFHDMLLGSLRKDRERPCSSDGTTVWVLEVYVAENLFNWTEQWSNTANPQPISPFGILYNIPQVTNRFPSDNDLRILSPLLGLAPTVQAIDIRTLNPLVIAAGYDLNVGSPPDPLWENRFQENFLTLDGIVHDWGIAIDPEIMQAALDTQFASMIGQTIPFGNQSTRNPVELIEQIFVRYGIEVIGFIIERISGLWGNPINIHVRGTAIISNWDDLDIEFDMRGRVVMDSAHALSLEMEMVPGSIDFDSLLEFIYQAAIEDSYPIPPVNLGVFDFSLSDGSHFSGRAVDQRDDGLVILGSATIPPPPEPPTLVISPGNSLVFIETLESGCSGGAPTFSTINVVLLNDGEALLHICRIENTNSNFQITHTWGVPAIIPPGEVLEMRITYVGPRGADVTGTIRMTCNDPRRMIREIRLLARAGGQPNYQIFPTPVVDVLVANTTTGRPVRGFGRCREISVPNRAAEFMIRNTGNAPLFLCQESLEDPDGVFVVLYSRETLLPNQEQLYPILFYPTQAMHDYYGTFRIQSNAGEIVIPIHGLVQTLPQLTSGGMTAYLPTNELCVPPNALCEAEPLFEPIANSESFLVQLISFNNMPPDGEVMLYDQEGGLMVNDYSQQTTRTHALAYTPNPDGGGIFNQACVPGFPGMGLGDRDLIRISVSGLVIEPIEVFPELENVTNLASTGGWVYVGTSQGLSVIDWRNAKKPTRRNLVGLGPIQALALSGSLLFAAVGDEVITLDLKRPEHPVLLYKAKLEGGISALGATRKRLFVLDAKHISAFEIKEGKLNKSSTESTPDGASQIGLFLDGVHVAGGKNLAVYNQDDRLQLHLVDRVSIKQPFDKLSYFGRKIFLSGESNTIIYEVRKDTSLHPIATYHQRFWRADFLSFPEPGRVFRIDKKGHVELLHIRKRQLDRSRFQDSLKLRYIPPQR